MTWFLCISSELSKFCFLFFAPMFLQQSDQQVKVPFRWTFCKNLSSSLSGSYCFRVYFCLSLASSFVDHGWSYGTGFLIVLLELKELFPQRSGLVASNPSNSGLTWLDCEWLQRETFLPVNVDKLWWYHPVKINEKILKILTLSIMNNTHREKLQLGTYIYWYRILPASDLFDMFT